MKKAGYALIFFFFCALGSQAQVQTQILCGEDDEFCIALDTIGGAVQWESSVNGSAYADLAGETSDTLCISGAQDSVWYRARFDLEGCPALYSDTIKVVHFEITANAGPDVTYCNGETMQLGASPVGGVSYSWSPMDALSDASIANPTTNAGDSVEYVLTATDANGCMDMDTVQVNVVPILSDSVGFLFSGNETFFVFPQCIDTLTLKLWGAEGADGVGGVASPGGEGGYAEGTLAKDLTNGDTIFLWVGGSDGFNGGGDGGVSTGNPGGNGGGATDIRYGGHDLSDRVLVAGGGGGSGGDGTGNFAAFGGGAGGAGGTTFGATGSSFPAGGMAAFGFGGTQVNAGPGNGGGVGGCSNGGTSSAGNGNEGGAGGDGGGGAAGCTAIGAGGGGGGGGYFGGSGGGGGEGYQTTDGQTAGGGGGGGGSSYIGGVLNGSMLQGGNTGNGRIRIVW